MYVPPNLRESEFFKGIVSFKSIGIFNTKYSIVENGAIIKVRNDTHVRCVLNESGKYPTIFQLPDSFEIIAPIMAVQIIQGAIPDNCIQWLSTYEYLDKHKKYIGEI